MEMTDEIESILADKLKKAIDDEIMNTIVGPNLIQKGWFQVVVKNCNWINISQEWCNENLSGKHSYTCFGYYWYFENEKDATIFSLRST